MSRTTSRISPELDELSSDLFGRGLDALADGEELGVQVAIQYTNGKTAGFSFTDDGIEACLYGARQEIKHARDAARYALVYEGAIADEQGSYQPALLMEFAEKGRAAYSAYSLVDGIGEGDAFGWTEPAAAGEVENLLD